MGGRSYPVCHYPVAMRLRDRKGRAILCLRLSSKWGLVGRCTRSAIQGTPSRFKNGNAIIGDRFLEFYIFRFLAQLEALAQLDKLEKTAGRVFEIRV